MIRHVVLWNLKDELTAEEKTRIKREIKKSVEELKEKLPGIVELKVLIEGLATSNADLMLDSSFESEEALGSYQVDPVHVEVANTKVKPYIKSRSCWDYQAESK